LLGDAGLICRYFATHDIPVRRMPHPRFAAQTPMGPRGDAIVQLDWSVGEILKTLDRLKIFENTLIIFSSDNGPVVDDGYHEDAVARPGEHKPAGPFRCYGYRPEHAAYVVVLKSLLVTPQLTKHAA
jgi:hypothetical protein